MDLYVYRDGEPHSLETALPIDVEIIEIDKELTKILSTMKSCIKSNIDTIFTLPKPILIRPGFRCKIELKPSVEGHCFKSKTIQFYDGQKTNGLIQKMLFNPF